MSVETETGRASGRIPIGAALYVAGAIFLLVAGFQLAPHLDHCGPRLLSLCIGGGLVIRIAGAVLIVRMLRGNALATVAFIAIATLFVLAAGPMMDQCRPGF